MILVEGIGFAPLTFLLMSAVLCSIDASFEEAALMAGASPLHDFCSITLRLGLPGVLALMLLIGIRAFESFEVPALVGLAGNVTVLTTTIYQSSKSIGATNFGELGAYSVCLLLIVTVLLILQTGWHARAPVPDHHRQGLPAAHRRSRRMAIRDRHVLLAIFLLVTVIPVTMLVFISLQPFYEGVTSTPSAASRWKTTRGARARLVPGFYRQYADIGRRDLDPGGAVHGAVRLARGAPLSGRRGCSIRSPWRRWFFRPSS